MMLLFSPCKRCPCPCSDAVLRSCEEALAGIILHPSLWFAWVRFRLCGTAGSRGGSGGGGPGAGRGGGGVGFPWTREHVCIYIYIFFYTYSVQVWLVRQLWSTNPLCGLSQSSAPKAGLEPMTRIVADSSLSSARPHRPPFRARRPPQDLRAPYKLSGAADGASLPNLYVL